jgi:hypothetical protein
MFVNEFFFSFSLLALTLCLFILGTVILADGLRRLAQERWSKPARQKNGGVVLPVDIARPVVNGISDGARNFLQRPLAMPDKKAS